MKKYIFNLILSILLLLGLPAFTQIKLKSKVELRNWQLTSKAMKSESFLSGALIKLYKGDKMISGVSSDANGNFEIEIPASGEYTLLVEYSGREPKKFVVNAKAVSPNKEDANFKPSVDIVGVLMSKPKKGMESIGLNHPAISFDHQNKTETKHHLRTNIYDGEYKLIQKFCTANKLGDMALENKNYTLAKTFYLMAADMIESEEYPKIQMKKAEEGIKLEKVSKKKQKYRNTKAKSAVKNQKPVSPSTIKSSNKSSVETGKPVRKTPKPL